MPDRLSIALAAVVCATVTVACGLTPLLEVHDDRPAVVLRREAMGPSPLTRRLRAGFVAVRKPKKLPAECLRVRYDLEYGTDTLEMHKDAIVNGCRVLIVDDLLATGGRR